MHKLAKLCIACNMISLILDYFPPNLKAVFNLLDVNVINRITEIRLHRGKRIILTIRNSACFIDLNGDLHTVPDSSCIIISNDDFDELFMKLCSYSVYNNLDTLKNGYLTLSSGVRVGIASSAVYNNEAMLSVKNITSLSIRIPHEIKSCSGEILSSLYTDKLPSIIVAGAPNSGKTTLLRALAYELSNGYSGNFRKVCVIDERNEICAKYESDYIMKTGANCDILTGFKKAQGIELATRSLSPEIIICDEISNPAEAREINSSFSSGCAFALSVHIGNEEDLLNKRIIRLLLDTGEFSYVVLLNEHTYNYKIIEVGELYEAVRSNRSCNVNNNDRLSFIKKA